MEKQTEKVVKKKQAISKSYTVKAFTENIKKLKEVKLISKEDETVIEEIKDRVIKNYINNEFK